MLNKSTLAAAIVAALCVPAQASSVKPVSLLSGTYLISTVENCIQGAGVLNHTTGTLTFDTNTGKAKLDAYVLNGKQIVLLRIRENESYQNSDTSLTLGSDTFHAFYGPSSSGISSYVTFIGLTNEGSAGCLTQGTLTRQ